MKSVIFLDYDNLLETHKQAGILSIVTKALMQVSIDSSEARGICDVRIYGGWYEGTIMTQLAQALSVDIQRDFPRIIRILAQDGHTISLTTNAQLAVSLLEEPGYVVFNSYRKKGKPANVRAQSMASANCINTLCQLDYARKLLKTGSCPIANCTKQDLVYRHEQKTVDTLLSCDLIYSNHLSYDICILVSGDDDFLPPIRSALLRGIGVTRFHPKSGFSPASFPPGGKQLIEKDL